MIDDKELPDGVDEEEVEEVINCPYCGETFESEVDEGVHRAEEHLNNDESIDRVGKNDKSLVSDWKQE